MGTNKAISFRAAFVGGLTIAGLKLVICHDTEPASSGVRAVQLADIMESHSDILLRLITSRCL